MKKTFLSFVFAFTSISILFAQDHRAETILNEMSAKYKTINTYNATFSYGAEANGKTGKMNVGNVTVKGNKYKLKTAGQEIFNNGKDIYTFVKETNEVNISDFKPNDNSDFSPSKIYTIYKKGFKYVFKNEFNEAGQAYDVVELSPTTKSNVSKIQITVNKKDKNIKSWKVWDKAGKITLFKIDKFVPNYPATDATFVFDKKKYPGVEVVDLR